MKSLASSFFVSGRMRTTEAKAKEARPYVEKMITRAKTPALANHRRIHALFPGRSGKKIFEHAVILKERPGGYTRILKIGQRKSDGARMAILELIKS